MSNERADQTKRCIPEIFEIGKDCLYVGAGCNATFQFVPELIDHNYKITLLEIWKPNSDLYSGHPWFNEAICSDIRIFDTDRKWDLLMWLHGPEHIHKEELESTVKKIEKLTRKLIVMACPWGIYPEGAIQGNPHEVHLSSLYEEDFKALGYMVDTIGQKDVPGSNLLSWKYVEATK